MSTFKAIILWLTLLFTCLLPASALPQTAPENRVWQIFSIGYDAPLAEATDLESCTETSTSVYDTAPIHSAVIEKIPTETNRSLFMQNAEFKAAEGGSSVTFYSVQSEADAARLASGGAPWPTGLQRANLGEGLYAWGSRADAEAYAANKSGVQILEHTMSSSDHASLNSLDLRTMSDENATSWLNKYSQYGEGQPHGLDHVIRTTGAGDEYYFSPSAFQLFK